MKLPLQIKTSFTLLTVISILIASNIYTLIPIYGLVADELGVPTNDVVLAGSLFTLFYAIGLLTIGPISDYTGRKNIIVFGLLASSLTTLAVGFSTDAVSLWLTRSIQGFVLAAFASVVFAYSFDTFPPKPRTFIVVLINTGFLVAGIFGQLTSSFLTEWFSWNSVFQFFSIGYFILFIAAFIFLTESPKPRLNGESLLKIYPALFRNKNLRKCYFISFTLLFSLIAFYDTLGRTFTGSNTELFKIRAAGLVGAILSLCTGKLIRKFGETTTLLSGLSIGVVALLSMLFFQTTIGLICFSILFISSVSLVIPTIITLIGSLGREQRANSLSLYSFILLSGASVAPFVSTIVPFAQMLLLLVALYIIDSILCWQLKNKIEKRHEQP